MDDIEFASQEGAYVYFLVFYSSNRYHGSFSAHLRHCMRCWYPWNGPLRILVLSVRVLVSFFSTTQSNSNSYRSIQRAADENSDPSMLDAAYTVGVVLLFASEQLSNCPSTI